MTRTSLVSCCMAALLALSAGVAAQTQSPVDPAQPIQTPAQPAAPVTPPAAPAVPPVVVPSPAPVAPVTTTPAAPAPATPAPAVPAESVAPAAQAETTTPAVQPDVAAPAAAGDAVAPLAPTEPVAPAAAPEATDPAADGAEVLDSDAPAPGQPLPSPHDLSPMGMYQQADLVVKSVMIMLVAACFLTWTVWLFKSIETIVARSRARRVARIVTTAHSLEEATRTLARRRDPAAFMAHAVREEYRRSDAAIEPAGPEGVKERAVSLVGRVEAQAAARMRRGMGLLATVGSVSPFVGLFGTVWGIMNAFIGIAETQTTNLAVVAPGIAEALFATALGLVAAIPAVVIYNIFTRAIAAYRQSLGDAGAGVLRLLSRDIDFRHVKGE